MLETPQITQTLVQLAAVIRLKIARDEIRNVMGPGLREIFSALAEQGIEPSGPWFTHHLKMDPEVFDFEICVPMATPVAPVGRVQPGQLPAARVARTAYVGPYEGLADAWGEFKTWIKANGHKSGPDLREIYVAGPESSPDPTEWRTELNRPLSD